MLSLNIKNTAGLLMTTLFLSMSAPGWAETVEYDGLIGPSIVVQVGAPAEGIVSEVAVDRGSLVKQGEILVELDSSVERAAFEKYQVMATFDGEIGLQKTYLEFAKRVHGRYKQLASISTHDKDQAATEIAITEYRLKKARENRKLAELELKKAYAELARRSIKSPISGVVVERYVSPGEYVNNKPLLRVAQIDPLRVEVIVPAEMFGRIRPGMTADVVPEMQRYGTQSATVTLVDKVIDSASNTFGVRLDIANADLQLPSGLRCLVKFELNDNADEVK